MLRAGFIMAGLDAGVPLVRSGWRPVTQIQGRPPSMTVAGPTSDKHAAYVVVSFITGG
jgi:hypothetical protein